MSGTSLPPEILKKIFSYHAEWWLSNQSRIYCTQTLALIPRPILANGLVELEIMSETETKQYFFWFLKQDLIFPSRKNILYFGYAERGHIIWYMHNYNKL
jgi:hypothetical protein